MSSPYILLQYGDDPFNHNYQDSEGRAAFTVSKVVHEPNLVIRLTREAAWSQQHPAIMGPDNSFFYFGAESRPGYIVYGGNHTNISMNFFLRPGKKDGSTSKYFRAQTGRDYKWRVVSTHRMECVDGRSVLAVWEVSQPTNTNFAHLTIKQSGIALVTEILTSLTLNRMAQSLGW